MGEWQSYTAKRNRNRLWVRRALEALPQVPVVTGEFRFNEAFQGTKLFLGSCENTIVTELFKVKN